MKKSKNILNTTCLMVLFSLLLAGGGKAQTVSPVYSQTFLQAPYYYRLHDWNMMPTDRMRVRIRMLDHKVENATLYLRMKMVSDNLTIENNRPLPIAIHLSGGGETELDAGQLIAYFLPANLQYSGKAKQEFLLSGGLLPDGVYRLYFEVYEASSGNKVSIQEMPAFFTLLASEPPILNLPQTENVIYYGKQNHIRFMWTPRHLQAAGFFQTVYSFELSLIPEGAQNWKEYFHTLPSILKEESRQPYFDYGAMQPQLIPGKQYAFRVRATCTNAAGESLYIKNEGYSEVFMFYYEEDCPTVPQLRITGISSKKALISWTEPIQAKSYRLQYRKNGSADARWFNCKEELTAGISSVSLTDLEPSTGYECRITVTCDYSQSKNNVIYRFTTLSDDNTQLQCGKHPDAGSTEKSQIPLSSLQMFDQVRTDNGFVFEIEEATGENGIFSGKGYTHIPLLANTGVRVKFKNVFINKNYELVSGVFKAEATIEE